jgi:hypothetical protein
VAVQVGLGVAGAALVGVGAKVLYDDGRQNCSMTGPIRQCPAIGDTTSQGAPLAAIGAVLFAGAVVSVALEYTLPNRRLKLTPLGDKSTAGAAISGVW